MKRSRLRVLCDAMHGAAGSLLPEILSGGELRAEPFRSERDALFGGVHPEPIGPNLTASAERVRAGGFDLAVAQDGDADRLGVLDADGRFVSPHQVLALLLLHVFRRRGLTGGIAKTFSTSFQIERIARALGAPLVETGIGFKFVAERMSRGEVVAGGEESGGYAFAFHLPERDGVLSALLLVESLAVAGTDLRAALDSLAAEFGRFEYGRRDVLLPVPLVKRYVAVGPRGAAGVGRRRDGDGNPGPGRRQVPLRRSRMAPAPAVGHGADGAAVLRAPGRRHDGEDPRGDGEIG